MSLRRGHVSGAILQKNEIQFWHMCLAHVHTERTDTLGFCHIVLSKLCAANERRVVASSALRTLTTIASSIPDTEVMDLGS